MFFTLIEPRLSTSASLLVGIDNNVRDLQTRANVWDTFQLHVDAWNEQIAEMDRKLHSINRNQEEFVGVYNQKLTALTSLENRLESSSHQINKIEKSLANINNSLQNKQPTTSNDGLFHEFAARGVLNTIKKIEKKLDNETKNQTSDGDCYNADNNSETLLHSIQATVNNINDIITKNEQENINFDIKTSVSNNNKLKKRELSENLDKYVTENNDLIKDILHYVSDTQNVSQTTLHKLQSTYSECCALEHSDNLQELIDNNFNKQASYIKRILEKLVKPSECTKTREITFTTTELPELLSTEQTEFLDSTVVSSAENDKTNCDELDISSENGIYNFNPESSFSSDTFSTKRYCEVRDNSFWTVIQRRDNYTNLTNFNVSWDSYKNGFGDLARDFWIGNELLYRATRSRSVILRIELEDFDNHWVWAEYSGFQVLSERDQFKLIVSGYSGNASDSFSIHNGSYFSTYDRKNDQAPQCCPCAVSYGGGWWFNRCFESNLNGIYYRTPKKNGFYRGIIWEHWLGDYSLKKTVMMIKTKKNDHSEEESISEYEDP